MRYKQIYISQASLSGVDKYILVWDTTFTRNYIYSLTLYLCSSLDYLDYSFKGLADVISNGSDREDDSEKDLKKWVNPNKIKLQSTHIPAL